MAKLILFSLIPVSVGVPIWLSTRRSGRRALRNAQWIVLAFLVAWAYWCIVRYPNLVPVS